MSFQTADTFLARRAMPSNLAIASKHAWYHDSYVLKHNQLLDLGFTFSWDFEGTWGDEEQLKTDSEFGDDDDPANYYELTWKGDDFIPKPLVQQGGWVQGVFYLQSGFDQSLKDDGAWLNNVTMSAVFLLAKERRFALGMAVRENILMVQLLAAQNVANIFCLDHRGRLE